jgi:hypothetical protein
MMTRSKALPPESASGDRRPTRASRWRDRASILALIAGFVSVAILVVEGPPGSGYGWGSVVISAGVVAVLFIAMSYLVRSDNPSRALAATAVAVLVVVMFGASLIGNWGVESAGFRALDTISTLVAVAASGVAFVAAVATVRKSGSPHSHHLLP